MNVRRYHLGVFTRNFRTVLSFYETVGYGFALWSAVNAKMNASHSDSVKCYNPIRFRSGTFWEFILQSHIKINCLCPRTTIHRPIARSMPPGNSLCNVDSNGINLYIVGLRHGRHTASLSVCHREASCIRRTRFVLTNCRVCLTLHVRVHPRSRNLCFNGYVTF